MITTILAVIAFLNTVLLFALYGDHVKKLQLLQTQHANSLDCWQKQSSFNHAIKDAMEKLGGNVVIIAKAAAESEAIQNAYMEGLRDAIVELVKALGIDIPVDKLEVKTDGNVISINFPKPTE